MAEPTKLDWFANWQNGVSFLAGVAAGVWLGPLPASHFTFVFLVTFAAARILTALIPALWKRLRRLR